MANKQDVIIDVIINGEKATSNMKDLQSTSKQLWKELALLTPGTDAFIKKTEEIKKVDARFKELKDAAKSMNGVVNESSTSFKGLWAEFAKGASVSSIISTLSGAIKEFFANSIEEALGAEKANRMLQNTLKNYGKEEYFDEFIADADRLAATFSYLDNDDIVAAQEKLVLFGKLSVPEIKKVTEVAIDLAARIGKSVPEATDVLIKALEGNGKALKEYGISISDAETTSERLKIVTGELSDKIKGSAADYANSTEGMIASTRQMRANLEEEIGNKLMPLFTGMLWKINDIMDQMKNLFSSNWWRTIKEFMGITEASVDRWIENIKETADLTKQTTTATGSATDGAIDPNAGKAGANKAAEDASKKAKEQADRNRKEAERKAEESRKLAAKLNADLLKIEEEAQAATLQLLNEGYEKEIAIENNTYATEVKHIEDRLLELKKSGATAEQINTAKQQLESVALINHQERLKAIETNYSNQREEAAKAAAEQRLKTQEENYNTETDLINKAFNQSALNIKQHELDQLNNAELTEDEKLLIQEQAATNQLLNEQVKLETLIKLQKEYGKSTIALEEELLNKKKKIYDEDAKKKKEVEEYKQKIGNAALGFFGVLVKGEIEMLSQTEESRRKNAKKIKTMQATQVALDGVQEVAAIWQNVQRVDNSLGNVYYAEILGAILTATAMARTGFAVAQIQNAKYFYGGHTGPGLGFNDNQGQVAGVVHANEWVSPQWMTTHPTYGPVINWLESNRVKGYINGGYVTTPSTLAFGMATSSSTNDIQGLRQDMAMYTREVSQWKTTLTAHVSATEADSELKNLETLKTTFQA